MRRKFWQFILLAILTTGFLLASLSHAQVPGISFSSGKQISMDNPKVPFFETFLAINPHDDRNLIATSLMAVDGAVLSCVYASLDGGRTWQRARTTTAENSMFKDISADPVVYFDSYGTAFFASLGKLGLLVSRSNDGGLTWEFPVTVPGVDYDRGYLAFDKFGGKFSGRMYAGGTIGVLGIDGKSHRAIHITFSTDNGHTFSIGTIIMPSPGEEFKEITDLLVAPDGKLVVSFGTSSPSPDANGRRLWTMVSGDGGNTFSPAYLGPSVSVAEGFRALKSHVAPRSAIDLSKGPYRGRIYLTWTDFDGKKYEVKIAHSTDLGKTWSHAIVVNDNKNGGDPANPAIAINKEGIVGVVFNDRRDDPENSCFRLYFAASVDGGETFLPNAKASERLTCPLGLGNWAIYASSQLDPTDDVSKRKRRPMIFMRGIPQRWPNGGDTQGLVAGSDGIFHSAWINGESGVMQLWSKELTVDRSAALESPFAGPYKDLSADLALEVSDPTIDFLTHTVSVRVRLVNLQSTGLSGPFSVVLDDIQRCALNDIHAVNSDNHLPARGAVWKISLSGSNSLQPLQKSDERIFRWEFAGGPSEEPSGPLFFAHFVILGQPQESAKSEPRQ